VEQISSVSGDLILFSSISDRNAVTPEQKQEFVQNPEKYLAYRKEAVKEMYSRFKIVSFVPLSRSESLQVLIDI
jgi:hypothetical protein